MTMSKKQNMTALTFCIPVRIDSKYRMRNLLAVLAFYSRYVDARYILPEADKERRIWNLPHIPGLRYQYIHDENPIFHRTHYINRMLSEVTTKVAAIWDTDAIVPIPQLQQAYERILQSERTMVYPYDGRFRGVDDFFSSIFCKHKKITILTDMDQSTLWPDIILWEELFW